MNPADHEVVIALRQAAKAILRRPLATAEQQRLEHAFRSTPGTNYQKALRAIATISYLAEGPAMFGASASDGADRAVHELEKIMQEKRR
jgi:hypothetical protein